MIDFDNITFCANKYCQNKKCERHPSLLEGLPKGTMVSMANFGGTCRDYIRKIVEDIEHDRLTHIDNQGWYVKDQSVAYDERRRGEEVRRLAAYEDTGLKPQEIKDMRNELCLKCGNYEREHLGACNGCRWKKES